MPTTVPVTADNFIRAETDTYFGMLVRRGGGVGRFDHLRQLHSVEGPGVRPNRDPSIRKRCSTWMRDRSRSSCPTLATGLCRCWSLTRTTTWSWSSTAGPAQPDQGPGRHPLCLAAVRILVDPTIPRTSNRCMACRISSPPASQPPAASRSRTGIRPARGRSATRSWARLDADGSARGRGEPGGGGSGAASDRDRGRVGPHPDRDAIYLNLTPSGNDGRAVHRLRVKERSLLAGTTWCGCTDPARAPGRQLELPEATPVA
jgi:hypothetical protein